MNAHTIPVRSPVSEPLSLDEAADEGWEDDLLPIAHPSMQQAIDRYNAVVADDFANITRGHRAFARNTR